MPHVVLVARGHEVGLATHAPVAALERAPGTGSLLVVLAHERPFDVALGVERGQLALQASRLGPVDGEAHGDHHRRIAPRRRARCNVGSWRTKPTSSAPTSRPSTWSSPPRS